jgi:thiol:disulfide interchange protein DsbD
MDKSVRILLTLLFIVYSGIGFSQILQPATWSTSTSKSTATVNEEIDLIFHVTIDPDWYMYSTDFDPDCGPIVTSFSFVPNQSYKLVGGIKPVNAIDKHEEIFDCDVRIFKKKAELRQRIKVLSANLKISGKYEYQVCTEVDGKCITFDDEFTFDQISVAGTKTVAPVQDPPV